jgi:hypothetical protein
MSKIIEAVKEEILRLASDCEVLARPNNAYEGLKEKERAEKVCS